MLSILFPGVGLGVVLQGRQLRQGSGDGFGRQFIALGIAPGADAPDVQQGEPVIFNGFLDELRQVFLITGASPHIGCTGTASHLANIQGLL